VLNFSAGVSAFHNSVVFRSEWLRVFLICCLAVGLDETDHLGVSRSDLRGAVSLADESFNCH